MPSVNAFGRRSFLGMIGAWALLDGHSAFADNVTADADADATAKPLDFEVRDFTVDGDRALGNRFVLCVPTHLGKDEKVPLLVALHGLGETVDQRTGAYAFVERYGLPEAYQRLRRPPVTRTLPNQDYFSNQGLLELNSELSTKPFRGIAIACPYMPNFIKLERDPSALDQYAHWISDAVIPTARREAPVYTDAAHTTIDGVSLGGYGGLEVFLRKPDLFGAWGCVQGALGTLRLEGYAEKLAAVYQKSRKDFHLETSKGDPFHDTATTLSDLLTRKGVPSELLVYPGPHDQPFLRESGILGMLHWHDARPR
jgi:hypothetical protein